MKRPIITLTLAILIPSIVLAWLVVRSLNNQQAATEQQEFQLQQERARRLAAAISESIEQERENFNRAVDGILRQNELPALGESFTEKLRTAWNPAQVGFIVSNGKTLVSPPVRSGEAARNFRLQNEQFLTNREPLEVYRFSRKVHAAGNDFPMVTNPATQPERHLPFNFPGDRDEDQVARQPAQFQQLIGDSPDGAYSRFLANELQLFFWTRNSRHPGSGEPGGLVFGAQIDLAALKTRLTPNIDTAAEGVCMAILDEKNKPFLSSQPGFDLGRATVFAEAPVGTLLPYWRACVYQTDPGRIARVAAANRWLVAGTVVLLVAAITIGTLLIITSVQRELALARQQTDFVSSVTHELKTPLTSIRMFAELLETSSDDPAKRARYLDIIKSETARLTRMIDNVLDFTRRHHLPASPQLVDLREITGQTLENLRPQIESGGFKLDLQLPPEKVEVMADPSAVAQILSNLISNAGKYSEGRRELTVQVTPEREILVLDRGIGVSAAEEEAIFKKFYRAKNAGDTGAGGAGLGLTISREFATSQGGTLTYSPREGGGSCFRLSLPA